MRKRLPIVAVALLFAIAAVTLLHDAPKPVKFTLADGTVIQVLKVTTGHHHRFRYDNRWQDIAGQFLPATLRTKLKPHILEYTTTNANSLVLWMQAQSQTARFSWPPPEITVADQHGVEVIARSYQPLPGAVLPGSSNIFGGRLIGPLPYHARVLTLAFYERSKRLGELKLPNPAYRGESSLRPEVLPQVKSADDVQVKLWSVDSSKSPWGGQRVDWRISTELTRDGMALPDWRVDKVEVFDGIEPFPWPEGSRSTYDSASQRAIYDCLGAWWPDAAWKLRLWVAQTTNFSASEIWILNDLPMPGLTETVSRNEVRQVGDSMVEWLGFSGPQAMPQTIPGRIMIQFRAPKTDDLRIVFVRGRDDQGRMFVRANGETERSSAMPGVVTCSFGLEPAGDARAVTLEFAVHRARSVDFIVKPNRTGQGNTAPPPRIQ